MSNLPVFIDLIRSRILTIPAVIQRGFTAKTIYRQFIMQKKKEDITFPCMSLCYDLDRREKWAAIDGLKLYISIHTKVFEDATVIFDAVVDSLHLFMDASTCVTVYRCWHEGGPPIPMYDDKLNCWEVTMEFSVAVG